MISLSSPSDANYTVTIKQSYSCSGTIFIVNDSINISQQRSDYLLSINAKGYGHTVAVTASDDVSLSSSVSASGGLAVFPSEAA